MIPARVQVAMNTLAKLQNVMEPCRCGAGGEPRELTPEEKGLLKACSMTITQFVLGESACESGFETPEAAGPVTVPIPSGSEIVMRMP